jgi:hypothetical protein
VHFGLFFCAIWFLTRAPWSRRSRVERQFCPPANSAAVPSQRLPHFASPHASFLHLRNIIYTTMARIQNPCSAGRSGTSAGAGRDDAESQSAASTRTCPHAARPSSRGDTDGDGCMVDAGADAAAARFAHSAGCLLGDKRAVALHLRQFICCAAWSP